MGMITKTFTCDADLCTVFAKLTVQATGPHDPDAFRTAIMMANADGWDISELGTRCPAHRPGELSSV